MSLPRALEYDVQRIVEFVEHQRAEPDEGQKHGPSDCFQRAHPLQFRYDMFSHRWEESLENTQKNLCLDHVMTQHETQAVEQEEHEWKEREQREKCKRGSQTGAPMAQKRSYEVSEKTKGLH